ncbi:hypothetical protein OsI_28680 [Oryza sativa Indica Group]|uniref:Uncharacterized protein n=1 Tax=Oryza sativa subsp. indica TaxID=39946 RepID=A2YTN1_ORYSI|nr:hypothetical protein OsI_28680 [Oryza sativa Indica Group]
MDPAAGGPRYRRDGVEAEGRGGSAARWTRRPAARVTGETGVEAETAPAMWRAENGGGARRDGSGGRQPGATGEVEWRWRAETVPAMWRRRRDAMEAAVVVRRDRDGMGMQPGWMRVVSRV